MRPRTRFALDIALMIALVAAYRPGWTGIAFHQWLSIAIIVPLLLHVVVNWEWALRILRTFIERLIHTSRLNLVVDISLLVATVAVMLSGFMVSPALIALLGIHATNPLVWHVVHSWSANATILLLAIHGLLHWNWFRATAKRLAETPAPARARAAAVVAAASGRGATCGAARAGATAVATARGHDPAPRRSRVGQRAKQAAAERAAAFRTASVLGVTGVLGLVVFAGVGLASPLIAHGSQPNATPAAKAVAKSGAQVCPATGCTASTCHGTTARVASSATTSAAKRAAATKAANAAASRARSLASARASAAAAKRAAAKKKVRMVCPSTGCTASSCHGTHHQSAASYYN
jgi:hypothetical protein